LQGAKRKENEGLEGQKGGEVDGVKKNFIVEEEKDTTGEHVQKSECCAYKTGTASSGRVGRAKRT